MTIFNYKSLVLDELKKVYKPNKFKIEPMWHQLVSLTYTLGEKISRVAYLHGVGTGKTICALLTNQLWKNKKTLVVCPSSAFGPWERDIKLATNDSYIFLTGSKKQRVSNLKKKKNYYIINYEGLKTIYANLREVKKNPFEKKKSWKIDHTSFIHNFDCIIFDEVHKCKDYSTLQSSICYELSRRSKYCIGSTGTPLDKCMLELFNIYKVVDLGDSLGTNFWYYREHHFSKRMFDWIIKEGHQEKILDKLSGHTISFDREECFDLPEAQTIERPILPSKEFLDLQEKIIEEDELFINETEIDCSSGTSKSQKLSQLSSGFLYYGTGKEREAYHLKENPKIVALIDLIEDSESKIIVVHKFIEEAVLIEKAFKKKKINFISVRGGLKANRSKSLECFSTDQNIKVLLIHPTCASEGFDGSIANTIIFFSPIASPKIRKQCEGRIHRKGQKNKCVFFDLVLKDSIDSSVNANRALRKDLVDTVMEYIRDYKKNVKK